jgi:uncharacterized protein (TIGR02118 family)
MVKFMILFQKPNTLESFEIHYNEFLALVERMPSVTRRQVINVTGSPVGESHLYRILEVYFEDSTQMETALRSFAGQEAGKHLNVFPHGSFEMVFADVYEESGGQTGA